MSYYYPQSKVEINGFMARYYDILLDAVTLGRYRPLIEKAIELMAISPSDKILDLGTGTGRNAFFIRKHLSKQGKFIGIDISKEMISQFKKRCAKFSNVYLIKARVDQSLPFKQEFDDVFISFVLHGFPHYVREGIIENVFEALKSKGSFFILDYNEFSLQKMPFYLRAPFKLTECPYAFDFIRRDWKQILRKYNFGDFKEALFFRNYIRLLKAKKLDKSQQKPVRIAVPTNDGVNIFKGMLGRAEKMLIYEIKNRIQFKQIERRDNPYANTWQHLKTLDVYKLVDDCKIIISSKIGKKGIKRLQKRGMKLFFRKGNIQESVADVIKEVEK